MENITAERVRLSIADARALAEETLGRLGFEAEEAGIISDHLLDAALCGYEYSGLPKILAIAENPRFREPRVSMRVERETPASVLFDAGSTIGMVAMYRATHAAIAKAREHGLAVVGVHNSWLSSRGAYYVEMIARAGLIGIHTVRANRRVAPPGGLRPTVGTNPIAFGFPKEGEPLVIDLGTSAIMFSDLIHRKRSGEPLPEGVAIDAQGNPTRDPALAYLGAVLPFGGYKGFALALAVEALGVFAGAGDKPDRKDGYVVIAIKPDLFVPLDEYRRQLGNTIKHIKDTPREAGLDEIRIPSERAFRERVRSLHDGIVIDRTIYDALRAIAHRGEMN